MYTYWETTVANNGYDYIDKGKQFKANRLTEVQKYGKTRLLNGDIKGWYIENSNGELLEKHTHTIC